MGKAVASCTAESYDFPKLKQHLLESNCHILLVCDDVLHAKLDERCEAFIFENGSFVVWPSGDPKEQVSQISQLVKPFELGPSIEPEYEELEYRVEPNEIQPTFEAETIVLPGQSDELIMSKLAYSNGLSDSVKLATLENFLQEHIAKVKHIPQMLQQGGRIKLTRSEVLKLIGELLHFRAVLNLQSELIDTPELYWSEPKLESIYLKTSRLLETRTRITVLNKKLDYANEMAQVLKSHLSEQHSLKLEWGIIALIAVEVAFELLHFVH